MKNMEREVYVYCKRMKIDNETRESMHLMWMSCIEQGLLPNLHELDRLTKFSGSEVAAVIRWEKGK